jgi:FixJ family two-component response regulator
VAGSAIEAETVTDVEEFRPELLLTDVVLPGGINGRQVAERLLARFPGLQVIFMSGYTRNAVVHDSRADGEITFLEKPFNADTLLHLVNESMTSRN